MAKSSGASAMCAGNCSCHAALAVRARLGRRELGETDALPGRAIALDDEGAHRRRIAIVMRGERALGRAHERQRQRVEALRGAVPGELVAQVRERKTEVALV